jgi:hypothetical protein
VTGGIGLLLPRPFDNDEGQAGATDHEATTLAMPAPSTIVVMALLPASLASTGSAIVAMTSIVSKKKLAASSDPTRLFRARVRAALRWRSWPAAAGRGPNAARTATAASASPRSALDDPASDE